MSIDMHAHWRPAELVNALRLRTSDPRVFRNDDGIEVYKARNGEQPISEAFDNVDVIPAGNGIMHQINLEKMSPVIHQDKGIAYPDTEKVVNTSRNLLFVTLFP